MDRENRLFLEDILAKTEAVMAQCTELKALVLSRLEADDEPDEKLRENAFEDAVPEDLPEDFTCPLCGVGKEDFTKED